MAKIRVIKVIIADDHAMVRQGLAQLLNDDRHMRVIGEAGNGLEAVAMTRKLKPDVVVLDYTMPVMDGLSAVEEIRRVCPRVKILILTVHENAHYAVQAFEAGAHGFVIKSAVFRELTQGIRATYAGKIYVSHSISEKMAETLSMGQTKLGLQTLSRREFELMRFLASGSRLRDCAKLMHITISAASTYRTRLLRKLRLANTAELIRFAIDNAIVG